MIIKIQQSLSNSEGTHMMLIYDKSKDVFYENEITKDIKKLLGKRQKAYFNAKIVNTKIQIYDEVKTQKW